MGLEAFSVLPERREVRTFGFKLNPMLKQEFIEFVGWHIAHRKRVLVTHLNLHGMATMYESGTMTRLMQRDDAVVTLDGMSVVFLSRLAGHKLTSRNRVTSLDYIDDLFARAATERWRVFYVGGSADVLSKGLKHFRSRYPTLDIDGHTGYFGMADTSPDSVEGRLVNDINARRVDLLIVGMGMPRQEEWVDLVRDRVDATVIVTIGALLEYYAGSLPMPPRWLGPLGLEWIFRLTTAPRRLAWRYMVEPFILLGRLRRGPPRGDDPPDGNR